MCTLIIMLLPDLRKTVKHAHALERHDLTLSRKSFKAMVLLAQPSCIHVRTGHNTDDMTRYLTFPLKLPEKA